MLVTPSHVPAQMLTAKMRFVEGIQGTVAVKAAIRSMATATMRLEKRPSLSTRTPPRADPIKNPTLRPSTAVATDS